jgi:hypothetical protein
MNRVGRIGLRPAVPLRPPWLDCVCAALPRRQQDQTDEENRVKEQPEGVVLDELAEHRDAGNDAVAGTGGQLLEFTASHLGTPDRQGAADERLHHGSLPESGDPVQGILAPSHLLTHPVLQHQGGGALCLDPRACCHNVGQDGVNPLDNRCRGVRGLRFRPRLRPPGAQSRQLVPPLFKLGCPPGEDLLPPGQLPEARLPGCLQPFHYNERRHVLEGLDG